MHDAALVRRFESGRQLARDRHDVVNRKPTWYSAWRSLTRDAFGEGLSFDEFQDERAPARRSVR